MMADSGRSARSGGGTRKRTRSGERAHACDEPGCEYRATTASGLTTHKRTHSGERPYACDKPGCEYRAAEAASLTTHKRTHSGERPYACDEPGCEYRATTAVVGRGSDARLSRMRDMPAEHQFFEAGGRSLSRERRCDRPTVAIDRSDLYTICARTSENASQKLMSRVRINS
ncbi:hypothetical protein T492DRAFT_1071565 [Pavlovales sp. CCMP2436]|nr:hypothetical protein T492DRAFT_1071565 [Pavlovales sp. CCMP2436]